MISYCDVKVPTILEENLTECYISCVRIDIVFQGLSVQDNLACHQIQEKLEAALCHTA
jgi:hypothetical protein